MEVRCSRVVADFAAAELQFAQEDQAAPDRPDVADARNQQNRKMHQVNAMTPLMADSSPQLALERNFVQRERPQHGLPTMLSSYISPSPVCQLR